MGIEYKIGDMVSWQLLGETIFGTVCDISKSIFIGVKLNTNIDMTCYLLPDELVKL